MAGWLSRYAREKKLEFFFRDIPYDAAVLDVGCADGWVKRWVTEKGWTNVTGIDLVGPADIVGDVNDWQDLGLQPRSFDVIVAFEVVEHCGHGGGAARPVEAKRQAVRDLTRPAHGLGLPRAGADRFTAASDLRPLTSRGPAAVPGLQGPSTTA